jgi:hypothetical protein
MQAVILIEILAVRVESSRGRHHPRVVKRKMSNFPTKARAAPGSRQVLDYAAHIRVVAPPGSAGEAGAGRPRGRRRAKPGRLRQGRAPAGRVLWLGHVRAWQASGVGRMAYCAQHGLAPRAFHQWVARARPFLRKRQRAPKNA